MLQLLLDSFEIWKVCSHIENLSSIPQNKYIISYLSNLLLGAVYLQFMFFQLCAILPAAISRHFFVWKNCFHRKNFSSVPQHNTKSYLKKWDSTWPDWSTFPMAQLVGLVEKWQLWPPMSLPESSCRLKHVLRNLYLALTDSSVLAFFRTGTGWY